MCSVPLYKMTKDKFNKWIYLSIIIALMIVLVQYCLDWIQIGLTKIFELCNVSLEIANLTNFLIGAIILILILVIFYKKFIKFDS